MKAKPYPKPRDSGGRLIRLAIATLKRAGVGLPLHSDILIGVSGGSDSVALGHLLARYGRRIVGQGRVHWLHVDHGWRGPASAADARWVSALAKDLGVSCEVLKLAKPGVKGISWEAQARSARDEALAQEATRLNARIFTAHHADDLAETVLWRILTGAARTHSGGILICDGNRLRPLLRVRKELLRSYLKEEGIGWREDKTNHEGRFLRSRMRARLMPELEALFPRAVEHLAELALGVQDAARDLTGTDFGPLLQQDVPADALAARLGALGIRLKRSHLSASSAAQLPKGWKLVREVDSR